MRGADLRCCRGHERASGGGRVGSRQEACPDCPRALFPRGYARATCGCCSAASAWSAGPGARAVGAARPRTLSLAWSVPRRRSSAEVIGEALLQGPGGDGYRTLARRLGRPPGAVPRWLRGRATPRGAVALLGCAVMTGGRTCSSPSSERSSPPDRRWGTLSRRSRSRPGVGAALRPRRCVSVGSWRSGSPTVCARSASRPAIVVQTAWSAFGRCGSIGVCWSAKDSNLQADRSVPFDGRTLVSCLTASTRSTTSIVAASRFSERALAIRFGLG